MIIFPHFKEEKKKKTNKKEISRFQEKNNKK